RSWADHGRSSTSVAAGLPGGAHHALEVVAHLPVEVASGGLAGGHDAGGVTGSPRADRGCEVDVGDVADRGHDLGHRVPGAAAEVVDGLQLVAGREALGRHDVREREVADVDVVTHA